MGPCILVRPGQTDYQHQGRVAGSLDLPLNEEGERQIGEIIDTVRELAPKTIYCGQQEPARATARSLGSSLKVTVKETEALGNLDQGLWQGLLIEDIRQKQPKLFRKWQDSPQDVTPPNGEDCESAAERVEFALKKPLRKSDAFVVVAPEPLATLIASIVRGESPKLSGPSACQARPLVEMIERDPLDATTRTSGVS